MTSKAVLSSSVRHRRRSARCGPLSLTPAQRLMNGCKLHELALVGLLLTLPVVLIVSCEILSSMLKFRQLYRPTNLSCNRHGADGSRRSPIDATKGGVGGGKGVYYSYKSKRLSIRLSSRTCALGFLLVVISCELLTLSTGQMKQFIKIGALAQEQTDTATTTTITTATTNATIIAPTSTTETSPSTARLLNNYAPKNDEPNQYCPDCGTAGDTNCDNVHQCTTSCGQVKSVDYPNNYGNNHRCRWSIKAPETYYVNLSITDFDIPSADNAKQCIFDYLTLIDGHTGKRLGCYCNENRPPQYIVSPWNKLIIQFDTNSNTTGRGFHLKYQFMRLELSEGIKSLLKPPIAQIKTTNNSSSVTVACNPGWQYFRGSCYKAYQEHEPLQWWDAQETCKKNRGNLVSILDKDEMLVILYLLTNVWESKKHADYYIGLIDETREGMYRWIDENPMSYTDWESKPILLEEETLAQPDGGAYEDCTIIRYNSYSRTSNWHDVPCALGKHYHSAKTTQNTSYKLDTLPYVYNYICKSKTNSPTSTNRRALYKQNPLINREDLLATLNNKYFLCDNLEVISAIFRCDGITHCRDGSDEKNQDCDQDCLDWQFKCAKSGRCTAIGNYCNFVDDCGDGSDESYCERARCKLNEFRCQNGQCIPAQSRCDLIHDCPDSSDEGRLCTIESKCNSNSTFQCYNGLCIPQYAVCDFQIDCPGKFHEDEDGPTCDLILKHRSAEYASQIINQISSISSSNNYLGGSGNSGVALQTTSLAKYTNSQRMSPIMSAQLQQDPSTSTAMKQQQQQQQQQNMFRCKSGNMISSNLSCVYEFDRYGYQIGCRDVSHLMNCSDFECPELDYVKCTNSYCIPWRYMCDGKWDCLMGDDEIGCFRYNCPGQYKCTNHSSCIPLHQLCDNYRQCPMGDDEFFCDLQCPPGCNCLGEFVDCHNASLSTLPGNYISKSVRKLDLSHNHLGPNLSNCDFTYHDLGELILHHNRIEVLIPRKFNHLRNLYKLDLSYNQIHSVKRGAFAHLRRVTQLLLESNPELVILEPSAFNGLKSLEILNISSSRILTLRKNTFEGLESLRQLMLRGNMIVEIEDGAFTSLTKLVSLDMRDNEIRHFTKQAFSDLKSLRNLSTDSFKFCCLMNTPNGRCLPLPDEVSDCEDLLSSELQRYVIRINGIAALLGNLLVIAWRYKNRLGNRKEREVEQVNSALLLSLACSDLLMGIYLIFIAFADSAYRGRYIENAENWRESAQCNLAGSLITVSSQVSVFILVSIAYNRYTEICLPFNSRYKLTLDLTHRLILGYWLVALLVATMPLFITPYFKGQFYAKSGVCMAFHITNQKAAGWLYSILIFICPRLIAFFIIVYCYKQISVAISRAARKNRAEGPNHQVRIAIIVLTHFIAWSPTICIELMSLAGIPLQAKVYSWIAVLVLPVNSAINPMIYTIPNIRHHFGILVHSHKIKGSGNQTAIQRLNNNNNNTNTNNLSGLIPGLNHYQIINGQQTKEMVPILIADDGARQKLEQRNIPPGYVPLRQFIRQSPQVDTQCLIKIAHEISRDIEEKHCEARVYASLNLDNVYVSDTVSSFPALADFNNTGSASDDGGNGDANIENSTASSTTAGTDATTAIPNVTRNVELKIRVFLADHDGYRLKRSQCNHDQISVSSQQRHRHHRTMQNCECFDVDRFGDILFKLMQLYANRKQEQIEEASM